MNSTMAEKQWVERGPPRLAPWFGAGGEAMQIGPQQGNLALFATELEPVGPGKSWDLLPPLCYPQLPVSIEQQQFHNTG
jgi:hypothetical protein